MLRAYCVSRHAGVVVQRISARTLSSSPLIQVEELKQSLNVRHLPDYDVMLLLFAVRCVGTVIEPAQAFPRTNVW